MLAQAVASSAAGSGSSPAYGASLSTLSHSPFLSPTLPASLHHRIVSFLDRPRCLSSFPPFPSSCSQAFSHCRFSVTASLRLRRLLIPGPVLNMHRALPKIMMPHYSAVIPNASSIPLTFALKSYSHQIPFNSYLLQRENI